VKGPKMSGKGIIECSKCGEQTFYEGDNPNDITKQTGYEMIIANTWLCPNCAKDSYNAEGC